MSADIRDRFRRFCEGGLSGREAARRLPICAATASGLARRPKRAPWQDFLIELVGHDPEERLAELRGALEHTPGVRASIWGVDQALKAVWLHV